MSRTNLQDNYRVTVLGGGAFGTVIAHICAKNNHSVKQWMRSSETASEINLLHQNTKYLPGCRLDHGIEATVDIEQAVHHGDIIFMAIPSKRFREVIKKIKGLAVAGKQFISTSKGFEGDSFYLMTQILEEELSAVSVGALSGPNLALEIMQKTITATVVASDDKELCMHVQKVLQTSYLRVYASEDPFGVQMGGALKNIYAIAAGMATAMDMGENAQSMLITRALAEMSRLAVTVGANPLTFLGLAGVGDLIATCSSPLSRNFRVGYWIAKGYSLEKIEEKLGQTAEGIRTLCLVREKALKEKISMPIVFGLYRILFEGKSMRALLKRAMLVKQYNEVEFDINTLF